MNYGYFLVGVMSSSSFIESLVLYLSNTSMTVFAAAVIVWHKTYLNYQMFFVDFHQLVVLKPLHL